MLLSCSLRKYSRWVLLIFCSTCCLISACSLKDSRSLLMSSRAFCSRSTALRSSSTSWSSAPSAVVRPAAKSACFVVVAAFVRRVKSAESPVNVASGSRHGKGLVLPRSSSSYAAAGGGTHQLVRVPHVHPRREELGLLSEERVGPHQVPDHRHHLVIADVQIEDSYIKDDDDD